ncbi:hypothetical protein AV530_004745 [Patagioenas fasciata monilis]|uniref:Uncharacterized protein n=1 Tax=Patagioenas fasciata monilis TaxID=372326 RepID=A0A1V4KRK5_PATFA|nr:hypothetical protein AV530_004745 [Patagioenas fasciata monilis]
MSLEVAVKPILTCPGEVQPARTADSPKAVCLEALLQFLAEGDDAEPPSRSAALSALQTFRDMGVLEELRGPAGPQLQLTRPFRGTAARAELEAFVRQFLQM